MATAPCAADERTGFRSGAESVEITEFPACPRSLGFVGAAHTKISDEMVAVIRFTEPLSGT